MTNMYWLGIIFVVLTGIFLIIGYFNTNCDEGQYRSFYISCQDCPGGYYKSSKGNGACSLCNNIKNHSYTDSYNNNEEKTGAKECKKCPDGSFIPWEKSNHSSLYGTSLNKSDCSITCNKNQKIDDLNSAKYCEDCDNGGVANSDHTSCES